MALILLLTLSAPVRAGWLRDLCERHLITDDPYQYEQVQSAYLCRQVERLKIKQRWGALKRDEQTDLDLMVGELRRRVSQGFQIECEP